MGLGQQRTTRERGLDSRNRCSQEFALLERIAHVSLPEETENLKERRVFSMTHKSHRFLKRDLIWRKSADPRSQGSETGIPASVASSSITMPASRRLLAVVRCRLRLSEPCTGGAKVDDLFSPPRDHGLNLSR